MKTELSEEQMLSALTAEQIRDTRRQGLVLTSTLGLDPVMEEVRAAVAKVDFYTAGWVVPSALATGWARDLAALQVVKRLSAATEDQVRAYERALKELEAVRDGKFGGAEREVAAEVRPEGGGGVRWGSKKRIF